MLIALRRRLAAMDGQGGFSMIEIVVAMVVFAVMTTAALGIILQTLDVTRSNSHRVAASNLATKQIESARSQKAIDIPDGAVSRTEVVGATTFTIEQNANYVSSGSDTSLCSGSSGELAYKLVSATVTWPDMGSVRPVTADTVLALGVGDDGLDQQRGVLAIEVSDSTGGPVGGVSVTLTPGGQTRTTGIDGCAVFVDLAVGAFGSDYTASVNQAGHVNATNSRAHQVVVGAVAGQVRRGELRYERSRELDITTNAPAGHTVPSGVAVGVRSSDIDTGAILAPCTAAGNGCVTGLPGQARNIFPAIYDVWAGSCPHPRPTGALTNVDLLAADGAVVVPVEGLVVRPVLNTSDSGSLPGYLVTATGSCAASTLDLPVTLVTGSRAALPAGDWTIRVRSVLGGPTRTATVTLTPGGGTIDLPIRVS